MEARGVGVLDPDPAPRGPSQGHLFAHLEGLPVPLLGLDHLEVEPAGTAATLGRRACRRRPARRLGRRARAGGGRTWTHTARITRKKKSQMRATTRISRARRRFWLSSEVRNTTAACHSRGLEPDGGRPHGDLVAVLEDPLSDRDAVHPGAVGRLQVGHDHVAPVPADLGVAAADVGVAQGDRALGEAADLDRLVAEDDPGPVRRGSSEAAARPSRPSRTSAVTR